jgi:dipeptidyl aminopeptidase/acylaminoacyl peptidase
MRRAALIGAAWAAGLFAACASAAQPAPLSPEELVVPNANLVAQGIPPIPLSLARKVALYNDFRDHAFVDWHPTRNEMLVAHRQAGANVTQLYRLRQAMGELEPLTDGSDPVTVASYEPRDGRYVVFRRAVGGSEAHQLFRLDLDGRQSTLLTDPEESSSPAGWIKADSPAAASRLLYTSVQLDRTAESGSRESLTTVLWSVDPLAPENKRAVVRLPGTGWFAGSVSSDGLKMSFTKHLSANESQLWIVDLAVGWARQVLPAADSDVKAVHLAGAFSKDGKHVQVLSDRASEFRELMSMDLTSGELTRVTAHIPWDVKNAVVTDDGRYVAAQVSVNGRDELRLFDGRTLKALPDPKLPPGSVRSLAFQSNRHAMAFSVVSQKGPGQVFVLDPATGAATQWTRAHAPAGVDLSKFADQKLIEWKSFDGLAISGLMSLPPARFTGKRPVIVNIHGGPEAQATMGFLNRWNYYVQELGIVHIEPNVRGSAGFGKTFLTLDDGYKREDAVKDIGSLLDWIARQPNLDASRVLITGGSYGGYMTLAASVNYADRIVGSVAVVAPSNFVTFLTNTESHRRDLRRVEYGDERDPEMRAFLEKIAPLNNAGKIKKPLFLVQGKNDPRVPYTESEQMLAKVRENGLPVWYLRAENEGHGFFRKENADFLFFSTVKFVEQTLLKP